MRTTFALVVLVLALGAFPGSSSARSWKGMVPGKTTRQQVIDKFGEANRSFSKGGELSDGLSYQGKQAIAGASEADFFFDKNGILFRIDVFPARRLGKSDILRVYGDKYTERVTPRGHTYFDYAEEGLVVFFHKDTGEVTTMTYTAPAQKAAREKAR